MGQRQVPSIREGLRIDPAAAAEDIVRFVRRQVGRLGKRGVTLGLSGGLDSTVCAYLCLRALGPERVQILILPERDSAPENVRHAQAVAAESGLEPIHVDLAPILEALGVYDLVPAGPAADRELIETGIRWIRRLTGQPSAFAEGIGLLYDPRANRLERLAHRALRDPLGRIHAFALTKVRLRMLVLYRHALAQDCLLVGTTDRSEWSVGFYDPFGDGAADIALLRHLYKTQIRQLALHLDIPPEVLAKPSSGDLAAGLPNETAIGLSYPELDAVLWGLEQGLRGREIAAQVGVSRGAIRAVRRAVRVAGVRRGLPVGVGSGRDP